MGLKEEDVLDRTKWKNDIHIHSGDPLQMIGKDRGEKEEEDEEDCLDAAARFHFTVDLRQQLMLDVTAVSSILFVQSIACM